MFYLLTQEMVIEKKGGIEYVDKTGVDKGERLKQILIWLTKAGGGVGEMLTLADKGGRGGGGGGGPPLLV